MKQRDSFISHILFLSLIEHQSVRIISTLTQLTCQFLKYFVGQGFFTAHNPEILVAVTAYQYVAIVRVNIEHVIVSIEPQEERNFQLAGVVRIGLFGLSLDFLVLPGSGPRLQHLNPAVG